MGWLFVALGALTFALGLYTTKTIHTDIQIQIVVTMLIGGVIMVGVGLILVRLLRIGRAVGAEPPPAPKRDPYA